ncbi:alpha beta-hydrolase [Coniophora puteana RWD-64-598 SS2]|uniref:Acyl-protein thioesterase 1 n=1 Tax=Coniophora puteana (strain RWD-64-598) TaxID=741705 RepID=A0A5M3M9A3_CONPW|nr:alpha beta-hydrolase [Coniophora puteana RWD-64-598 SS2]EIW75275.1 alpha beta-hydrolase [Coniophora puteana RWD-64-598 SS2]
MAATTASKLVNDTGKRAATLIFLHGLGDTPSGWRQSFTAKYLNDPSLSHITLVTPSAPRRYGPGYSWYHIGAPDNESKTSLNAALKMLDALIQEQVDAGVPQDRIVLGGFSQGAGMTLATAFTASQELEAQVQKKEWKLGGVMALAGYVPREDEFRKAISPTLKDTPIFWGHGNVDSVVKYRVGEASIDKLHDLSPSLNVYKVKHTEGDWQADTDKRIEGGTGEAWKSEKHAWIERHEYDDMDHGPTYRWHDQAMEKHMREWLRRVVPV